MLRVLWRTPPPHCLEHADQPDHMERLQSTGHFTWLQATTCVKGRHGMPCWLGGSMTSRVILSVPPHGFPLMPFGHALSHLSEHSPGNHSDTSQSMSSAGESWELLDTTAPRSERRLQISPPRISVTPRTHSSRSLFSFFRSSRLSDSTSSSTASMAFIREVAPASCILMAALVSTIICICALNSCIASSCSSASVLALASSNERASFNSPINMTALSCSGPHADSPRTHLSAMRLGGTRATSTNGSVVVVIEDWEVKVAEVPAASASRRSFWARGVASAVCMSGLSNRM
mmetsp:Transcript_52793/g.153566  ORF Transcript_52793/g.153566 Transcript_52793/m.153566 type:complete len:290 (+) Transcript_52793:1557-2426(+)